MCADPAAAKEIAAIKAEIENLDKRARTLENTVNGDGSKEKGIMPRLTTMETKINLLLWILGLFVTTVAPACVKFLFYR